MVLQSDAKKLLDPDESYQKAKNETLLDKYRIPVQHFEYSYIETCKDGRELEKIVKVLRSGEEGYFPDLTTFAEKRLAVIKPRSKLLKKACPVLSKDSLDKDERSEIANDLTQWIATVSKDDDELVYFKNRKSDSSVPEVRKMGEKFIDDTKSKKSEKRISATDYSSWDKYDPDTEILKMDLHEENLKKSALDKEKKKPAKKTVQFKEFTTDVEALREANYEKDKGNEFFKAGDYAEALRHYTNSINCKPTLASFNNRALANIKLKKYKNAMDDCHSALAIDPDNFKALLRKAQALEGLGRHMEALETAEQAIEVDANNTVAQELAEKFRKLCGKVPKKSTRFVVQEFGKDEKNKKNAKSCKKVSKDEVIIPIPGTSKMSPPHYITCSNDSPDKVKEHAAKANTQQIVHLISVENSDGDDDDCCTVNHLRRICSSDSLDKNNVGREEESKIVERTNKWEEAVDRRRKSPQEDSSPDGGKEDCSRITNENERRENKEVSSNSNSLKRIDITEISTNVLPLKSEKTKESVVSHEDKKIPTQQVVKEDKCAGGEPYTKDDHLDTQQDMHSPYNFLKTWNSANSDKTFDQHASILRSIDTNRIVEVIGCKLDNAMFSTMVKCLCAHFSVVGEVDRLHTILTNIVSLPRFDIISMLMSSEDRNCVGTLVDFLKQHGKPLSDPVVNKLLNN